MEWRCGRPAASRGATRMLAACSPPGRWQRWRQATENNGEAHRREPSGRRGRREQPGARRELGERLPWMRRTMECGMAEERFRRTPTWRAKCRISGSGRPLRFEHWGARGDFASYLPAPLRLAKI